MVFAIIGSSNGPNFLGCRADKYVRKVLKPDFFKAWRAVQSMTRLDCTWSEYLAFWI